MVGDGGKSGTPPGGATAPTPQQVQLHQHAVARVAAQAAQAGLDRFCWQPAQHHQMMANTLPQPTPPAPATNVTQQQQKQQLGVTQITNPLAVTNDGGRIGNIAAPSMTAGAAVAAMAAAADKAKRGKRALNGASGMTAGRIPPFDSPPPHSQANLFQPVYPARQSPFLAATLGAAAPGQYCHEMTQAAKRAESAANAAAAALVAKGGISGAATLTASQQDKNAVGSAVMAAVSPARQPVATPSGAAPPKPRIVVPTSSGKIIGKTASLVAPQQPTPPQAIPVSGVSQTMLPFPFVLPYSTLMTNAAIAAAPKNNATSIPHAPAIVQPLPGTCSGKLKATKGVGKSKAKNDCPGGRKSLSSAPNKKVQQAQTSGPITTPITTRKIAGEPNSKANKCDKAGGANKGGRKKAAAVKAAPKKKMPNKKPRAKKEKKKVNIDVDKSGAKIHPGPINARGVGGGFPSPFPLQPLALTPQQQKQLQEVAQKEHSIRTGTHGPITPHANDDVSVSAKTAQISNGNSTAAKNGTEQATQSSRGLVQSCAVPRTGAAVSAMTGGSAFAKSTQPSAQATPASTVKTTPHQAFPPFGKMSSMQVSAIPASFAPPMSLGGHPPGLTRVIAPPAQAPLSHTKQGDAPELSSLNSVMAFPLTPNSASASSKKVQEQTMEKGESIAQNVLAHRVVRTEEAPGFGAAPTSSAIDATKEPQTVSLDSNGNSLGPHLACTGAVHHPASVGPTTNPGDAVNMPVLPSSPRVSPPGAGSVATFPCHKKALPCAEELATKIPYDEKIIQAPLATAPIKKKRNYKKRAPIEKGVKKRTKKRKVGISCAQTKQPLPVTPAIKAALDICHRQVMETEMARFQKTQEDVSEATNVDEDAMNDKQPDEQGLGAFVEEDEDAAWEEAEKIAALFAEGEQETEAELHASLHVAGNTNTNFQQQATRDSSVSFPAVSFPDKQGKEKEDLSQLPGNHQPDAGPICHAAHLVGKGSEAPVGLRPSKPALPEAPMSSKQSQGGTSPIFPEIQGEKPPKSISQGSHGRAKITRSQATATHQVQAAAPMIPAKRLKVGLAIPRTLEEIVRRASAVVAEEIRSGSWNSFGPENNRDSQLLIDSSPPQEHGSSTEMDSTQSDGTDSPKKVTASTEQHHFKTKQKGSISLCSDHIDRENQVSSSNEPECKRETGQAMDIAKNEKDASKIDGNVRKKDFGWDSSGLKGDDDVHGKGNKETSATAPLDNHDSEAKLHSAAAAIERFAVEMILPSLMAAGVGEGGHGRTKAGESQEPNCRAFVATLLALREVLTMNSDAIFFDSRWRKHQKRQMSHHRAESISSVRRRQRGEAEDYGFRSRLLATAVILSALERLGSEECDLTSAEFSRAVEKYDGADEEFVVCLERADGRSHCVAPGGRVLGREEAVAWRVSFNEARESHPLIQAQKRREAFSKFVFRENVVCGDYKRVESKFSERIAIPSPNACSVYIVERLPPDTVCSNEMDVTQNK